jgi:hypothetical protein
MEQVIKLRRDLSYPLRAVIPSSKRTTRRFAGGTLPRHAQRVPDRAGASHEVQKNHTVVDD